VVKAYGCSFVHIGIALPLHAFPFPLLSVIDGFLRALRLSPVTGLYPPPLKGQEVSGIIKPTKYVHISQVFNMKKAAKSMKMKSGWLNSSCNL
jgi:hypothetical protein